MGIDLNVTVSQPFTLLAMFPTEYMARGAIDRHDGVELFGRHGRVVRVHDVIRFNAKKDGALEVNRSDDGTIHLGGEGDHVEAIEGFVHDSKASEG